MVTVHLPKRGSYSTVKIFDVQGRNCYEDALPESESMLDLSRLMKGIYLIQINSDGKQEYHKILIK
jgi:hypothetical protein